MSIEAVDIVGRNGMVASTSELASPAGREMLLAGGNAIDAAVATALALCVVQPSSNGIAGYGGSMVIYLDKGERVVGLDYNCKAPRAAHENMYELAENDEYGEGWTEFPPIKDRANFFGPLAVSVPGTIAGLHLAQKTYGKLGWRKVCMPAIRLAADGFPVYEGLPENIHWFTDNADPISVEALFPGDRVPQVGEIWKQPDLAVTIEAIAADPGSFYRGKIAHQIVDRVRSAGGILTRQDMADFRVEFADPIALDYRGFTLHASTGVTGSICTLETLAILQKLNPDRYATHDARYWGDLAGALVLAWRDRLAYIGDVPGIQDKVRELLSDEHASELAEMVRSGKVTAGGGPTDSLKETVHLTTCDEERNMVSLTQTHGGGWGTRFAIPGTGLVIGHGMSRFDPRPGLRNSPGPYKQPLHNMSPLIITRGGGEPIGTVGLPGGRTIPAVVANLVAHLLDMGYSPAMGISAPRIHTQGGVFSYCDAMPQSALDEIKARGHEAKDAPAAVGGNVSVIMLSGDRIIGSAQASKDASLAV